MGMYMKVEIRSHELVEWGKDRNKFGNHSAIVPSTFKPSEGSTHMMINLALKKYSENSDSNSIYFML